MRGGRVDRSPTTNKKGGRTPPRPSHPHRQETEDTDKKPGQRTTTSRRTPATTATRGAKPRQGRSKGRESGRDGTGTAHTREAGQSRKGERPKKAKNNGRRDPQERTREAKRGQARTTERHEDGTRHGRKDGRSGTHTEEAQKNGGTHGPTEHRQAQRHGTNPTRNGGQERRGAQEQSRTRTRSGKAKSGGQEGHPHKGPTEGTKQSNGGRRKAQRRRGQPHRQTHTTTEERHPQGSHTEGNGTNAPQPPPNNKERPRRHTADQNERPARKQRNRDKRPSATPATKHGTHKAHPRRTTAPHETERPRKNNGRPQRPNEGKDRNAPNKNKRTNNHDKHPQRREKHPRKQAHPAPATTARTPAGDNPAARHRKGQRGTQRGQGPTRPTSKEHLIFSTATRRGVRRDESGATTFYFNGDTLARASTELKLEDTGGGEENSERSTVQRAHYDT